MEQELEEEEEVDPRIQVGRTGDATDPAPRGQPRRSSATLTPASQPPCLRPGAGGGGDVDRGPRREGLILGFARLVGRLRCLHGCGLNILRESPRRPPAGSGDRRRVPSGWADVQQREKGGGGATRGAGVPQPGSQHRGRCTTSWPWAEGLAAGWALSAPAAWAGTGARGSESSPSGGARLEPSSFSFDCYHIEGCGLFFVVRFFFLFCFFWSPLAQPSTWPHDLKPSFFLL